MSVSTHTVGLVYIQNGEYWLYNAKTEKLLGVFVTEWELITYCKRFGIEIIWAKE